MYIKKANDTYIKGGGSGAVAKQAANAYREALGGDHPEAVRHALEVHAGIEPSIHAPGTSLPAADVDVSKRGTEGIRTNMVDAARIPVGGPGAEGSPAAPTAGEQAVAPGTEAQAATPGQTPSIGPAAQTGPGEAGTVNQAPQAAETTQVAGSPGPSTETPRIGLKVGNSIIKVPVEHTDLQERLSQAESAHEQRKADIAGQFPGEENKKQRGDAYRDSDKALAQEKRAIVTEILARQSQNVPDPQPNLVYRENKRPKRGWPMMCRGG